MNCLWRYIKIQNTFPVQGLTQLSIVHTPFFRVNLSAPMSPHAAVYIILATPKFSEKAADDSDL